MLMNVGIFRFEGKHKEEVEVIAVEVIIVIADQLKTMKRGRL